MKRPKRKLHKLILFLLLVFLHDPCYAMTSKECLASAIFHEARGEPIEGQRAVGHVVLNRSRILNKSICHIVKQEHQFSFVRRGLIKKAPQESHAVAEDVMSGQGRTSLIAREALFFVSIKVKPRWAARKRYLGKIGQHKFYK